ncbi:MAG TPA: glycosyltransferase [Candidatus Caenarcaniphilales bacterium]
MSDLGLGLTILSLGIWVGLLGFRGQFWRADQRLEAEVSDIETWPSVWAVVPARNEANLLPVTMRALLSQNYSGDFKVVLVDDQSTDGTASVAQQIAQALNKNDQLTIRLTTSLPSGWTGKLWALEQGIQQAQSQSPPDYLWLTDADIEHDASVLRRLVAKAEQEKLDLVSLMVLLRCQSFWEHLLIPAFVFFFQKLYPFRWVNDPSKSTAAAAGGCILIRRSTLNRVGGIQVIHQALIDDCALAQATKADAQGRIWLGVSSLARSLRPYPALETIWEMVARTAFTQLNYSPLLLLGTLLGMGLLYGAPPVAAVVGILGRNWLIAIVGFAGWLLMAFAYLPTLRLYRCSPLLAFCLPAIAFLYTAMTLDSALRHWRGQGGAWKGRIYSVPANHQARN